MSVIADPQTAVSTGQPLAEARRRLAEPSRPDASLRLLAASALLAISAILLAGSMILGPFWETRATPDAAMAGVFAP